MIPVFSIIIPSYKSDKFIKQCISSVLHQTYRRYLKGKYTGMRRQRLIRERSEERTPKIRQ